MSSSELAPGPFLLRLAAAAAAAVALLLAATWAVDPLGQLPGTPPLCADGIKIGNSGKALIAAVRQPEQVLLGSSRVAAGFSRADAEALAGPGTANLAVHAASIEEIDVLARSALDTAPVRRLWIGLDFAMFLPSRRETRRFAVPAAGRPPHAAAWRHGLFDLNAVQATVLTALRPGRCRRPETDPDGFANLPPPEPSPDDRRRFDPTDTVADLASRGTLLRRHRSGYAERLGRLARLARLAEHARSRGADTIVFVAPIHPLYAEAIRRAGLEPLHRRWRADLPRALGAARVADLTDAALISPDCLASSAPHCPFSDLVHFRAALGRQVLLAVRGAQSAPLRPSATQ